MLKPVIEDLKSQYTIEEINIEDTSEEILTKYKVRNIPLLVLENEEGNELWRHTGFITKDELTKELDKFKE
jgi:thioredoxin-related protein